MEQWSIEAFRAASPWSRLAAYLPKGGTLPEEAWTSRHRAVLVLLWAHAAVIALYAAAEGFRWEHIVLEGLVVPAAALVAGRSPLSRRVRTVASALGLLSASGLLVHLSGGLIEMHFHFFVMVMVISLYQDWRPFLAAIGYVLVHHGVVGVVDPRSVYNHPAAINDPWLWAAIHAFFIAGASAACLVNWRLNESHLGERRRAEQRLLEEQRIVERLNEVGKILASDLEFDHVVQLVTDVATELTSAAFGAFFYGVSDDRGDSQVRHAISGPEVAALGDLAPLRNSALFAATFADRAVVRLDDVVEDSPNSNTAPDLGILAGYLPVRSYMAVPVLSRGRVIGGLFFGHPECARFTQADERIAVGIAAHAAVAVENARLFAGQRAAAETLQRALLPDRLPVIPGVQVHACYVPAGEGAEIGGDWYDVIALADGRVGLVMGDVVGHGIPAASLMGQLRNAVRAYAIEGRGPAEVLTRLNALIGALGSTEHMATAFYGVYDPAEASIVVSNAGHPPAVVRHPGGRTSLVECALGVPLGAVAGYEYLEESVSLEPGSTLVLYTDGLVEGPELRLDEGIRRVHALVAAEDVEPKRQCEVLLDSLTGARGMKDDMAVVALRTVPLGDHLHLVIPTDAVALRPLRAVLRRWLATTEATERDIYEILVATMEACSNVIRHSGALGPATFDLDADYSDDVVITVRNEGRWREYGRPSSGGRGLEVIRQFMDTVDIAPGPPETVVTMRRAVGRVAVA